jgi:hypothetical protein
LGTARPFPLWRLPSGPQSSSVDQYSETPPEHLALTVAEAMHRSVVTRHCLSKNLDKIERLNREVGASIADSKIDARLANLGATVLAGSPGDFAKLISDETRKWGNVIPAANIKAP